MSEMMSSPVHTLRSIAYPAPEAPDVASMLAEIPSLIPDAQEHLRPATIRLRDLLRALPWGDLGHGWRIVSSSGFPSMDPSRSLLRFGRVVATLRAWEHVSCPTRQEAEALYRADRERRRAWARAQEAERQAVIGRLRSLPIGECETLSEVCADLGWIYLDGQEGGSIRRRWGCPPVSARGVLRASGLEDILRLE
jgi:hypothetical protein